MIIKEHQDFAKEVVALARKHKMTALNMTYRFYGFDAPEVELPEGYIRPYDSDVRLQWSQGRHGATDRIRLEASSAVELPESKDKGTE